MTFTVRRKMDGSPQIAGSFSNSWGGRNPSHYTLTGRWDSVGCEVHIFLDLTMGVSGRKTKSYEESAP